MATFSNDGSDFDRLDWRLLETGAVSLYFRRDVLEPDVAWLREHGYRVVEFGCGLWTDPKDMHEDIASELDFPDYYGKNLDAMNDCIADLDVPAEGGLALVFWHFDDFASHHRKVAQAVLDILADKARRFLLFGRRLLVLVQSDDPHFWLEPVGATAVTWNPKEFLPKNRDR